MTKVKWSDNTERFLSFVFEVSLPYSTQFLSFQMEVHWRHLLSDQFVFGNQLWTCPFPITVLCETNKNSKAFVFYFYRLEWQFRKVIFIYVTTVGIEMVKIFVKRLKRPFRLIELTFKLPFLPTNAVFK